jgi:hypothetical protein
MQEALDIAKQNLEDVCLTGERRILWGKIEVNYTYQMAAHRHSNSENMRTDLGDLSHLLAALDESVTVPAITARLAALRATLGSSPETGTQHTSILSRQIEPVGSTENLVAQIPARRPTWRRLFCGN